MEIAITIAAIVLIIGCIIITVAILLQETQQNGMSSAITGSSGDNYYDRTKGNSKEAKLRRLTAILVGVFMAITLGVNLFSIYYKTPVTAEDLGLTQPSLEFKTGDGDEPALTADGAAASDGTTADAAATTADKADATTAKAATAKEKATTAE